MAWSLLHPTIKEERAVTESRIEEDLLGSKEVPADAYYGVHTVRAIENFTISPMKISDVPEMVRGMVMVKKASAMANKEMHTIPVEVADAIIAGCDQVLEQGRCMDQFPVDVFQGGAGTSVNMNTNEVIANLALEHMGLARGRYDVVNPNEHVNECQSTNDAYPSGLRIAVFTVVEGLKAEVENLASAFETKAKEFDGVLKMGRTQLQDAVPMTLGQEFTAFGLTLRAEIRRLSRAAELLLVVNQVCFKVIGNDVTVSMAAGAGQLQLNVMEPVIAQALFESVDLLVNACRSLRVRCVDGITANPEVCSNHVMSSIGIVTFLNPSIGHHNGDLVGRECARTGKSVRDVVLELGLLSEAELDEIFSLENLMRPRYRGRVYASPLGSDFTMVS